MIQRLEHFKNNDFQPALGFGYRIPTNRQFLILIPED